MPVEFIQSRQNPRVQNLARLHERAHRDEQGRFLVEGRRELERALARGVVEEIYFCPEYFPKGEGKSPLEHAEAKGVSACRLSPSAFDKASLREGPDGLLGVACAWQRELTDLKLPARPLLLVVERVEKPGNLGALLRTADAAGVHAVIVCDPATDLFNPHVVRNSQGSLFSVPVAAAEADDTLVFLRTKKIAVIATTPDAAIDYWDADLRAASAIVVGSENKGLTKSWIDGAATRVRIPMAGQADSLNVSAAAALVLFEAVRQRRR